MQAKRLLASVFLDATNISPDFKTMSGLYKAVGDENFSPTIFKENAGNFVLMDRVGLTNPN